MNWLEPPEPLQLLPQLSSNVVHVWRTDLGDLADLTVANASEKIQQLLSTLSEDERCRAERFRFTQDRLSFIAARGILRKLLSQYLQILPEQLTFSYTQRGKPFLNPCPAKLNLQFNLSHSQAKALYAITLNHRIGIDIELIRPIEVQQIAQRFFSSVELHYLNFISPEKQVETFYQLWVCREAYLKATGEGLAELRNIQVQLSPDSKQFQVMRNQDSLTDWHFHQLDIHPSYKAAIAIEAVEAVQLAFYNCYY